MVHLHTLVASFALALGALQPARVALDSVRCVFNESLSDRRKLTKEFDSRTAVINQLASADCTGNI